MSFLVQQAQQKCPWELNHPPLALERLFTPADLRSLHQGKSVLAAVAERTAQDADVLFEFNAQHSLDNQAECAAVATCMNLAVQADAAVAVVHFLLVVEAEAWCPDETRSLVGFRSLQGAKFRLAITSIQWL